jgi:hypothetical protein
MTKIVDELELVFQRGRRLFANNKKSPICPDEKDFGPNHQTAEWLGFVSAKAAAFFKRQKAMEKLGIEDKDDIDEEI